MLLWLLLVLHDSDVHYRLPLLLETSVSYAVGLEAATCEYEASVRSQAYS
jgi:hypothetical protein